MYIKILCTSNKAFWSGTLCKFLQKQIIINTTIKWKNAFLGNNLFKSNSMQKTPLPPVKASWPWMDIPNTQQSFSFQSYSSASEGAEMHVPSKRRSISQWNLNKVKWRTLCKKGCRQFHPNNTSSKEQRNARETAIPFSFSPSPSL